MKKSKILLALLLAALLLAGCGKGDPAPAPTAAPTAEPTATPTEVPTAAPTAVPTQAPTAAPTLAPTLAPALAPTLAPTPTPTVVPTATPTPKIDPPYITKHPVNTTVEEGGSCQFEAGYVNAIWAVWHFVSPDGQTDITYEEIGQRFPSMQVANGMYSTMQLSNIPIGANGWKVYCRYTNDGGYTNTNSAVLTVTERSAPVDFRLTGDYRDSVSQRASMNISGPASQYSITIHWGSSYKETAQWSFSGSFNSSGIMNYSNCTKKIITYDDAGNSTTVVSYSNGTGSLTYSAASATITWVSNFDTFSPCQFVRGSAPRPTDPPVTNPPVVNDWVDTSDLYAAVSNSGVDFDPPASVPDGFFFDTYSSRPGIIEVRYSDNSSYRALVIRKSASVGGDALSGDYNGYSMTWDISIKGVTVHCKGDGSTANVAAIDAGIGHFSIVCHPGQEGCGLTPDQINSIVNGMQ